MSESNELVTQNNNDLCDSDILNSQINFSDKIGLAKEVATNLSKVIKDCRMSIKIKGNEYVTVEGWSTLGTCLGVYAYVEEVIPIESEKRVAYKATVSIRNNEGQVFSRASAISTSGEGRSDDYAIYSMAQTRATGKAFRLALGWIMSLSGYTPTPYEEMVSADGESNVMDHHSSSPRRINRIKKTSPKKSDVVIDAVSEQVGESVEKSFVAADELKSEEKSNGLSTELKDGALRELSKKDDDLRDAIQTVTADARFEKSNPNKSDIILELNNMQGDGTISKPHMNELKQLVTAFKI